MAQPSKKSPALESELFTLLGFSRRATILADRCAPEPYGCGGEAKDFRDELSRKEYSISGLCQRCQDEIFR